MTAAFFRTLTMHRVLSSMQQMSSASARSSIRTWGDLIENLQTVLPQRSVTCAILQAGGHCWLTAFSMHVEQLWRLFLRYVVTGVGRASVGNYAPVMHEACVAMLDAVTD